MARSRGLAGLIFDVDGTLVDSNDLHALAWSRAFRIHGKRIPPARIRPHVGKGGDLLVPDLLDAAEMRAIGRKVQKTKRELFRRDLAARVKPFPGVREAFEALRERGIRLVLASSSQPQEVRRHIELLGIGRLIDGATTAADARFSKPSPEIFLAALDRIRAPKSRTAIVGDTPYDILAAHRAATPVAALRIGGFPPSSLRGAEWLFRDVPDLVRRLDRIDAYFRR